ncbi:capsule biosynthesis GfcC family protein [Escherichia coli]
MWNHRLAASFRCGFSAHVLPEKYADLNDQIVSVLTQRVPD